MPELPEVEVTRLAIAPAITAARVTSVTVRERRLRWNVPLTLGRDLPGQAVAAVDRRAKYLLVRADTGTMIIHLGMSGRLRVLSNAGPAEKHDHVDIDFDNGVVLRFTDPRRFGSVLWTRSDPLRHRLLANLGPEPLETGFSGDYLHATARGRRAGIKQHIMNAATVVGVGNIYASEALFLAGIHPLRAAGRIALPRMQRLAAAIRSVLTDAIRVGGTTLNDFSSGDGEPGYFQLQLHVYGREDAPCPNCTSPIRRVVIGQRSSFYCPRCQT